MSENSILSKFKKSAQSVTLQNSQEQFEQETKSLKKSGIFSISKDGTYTVQVLPTKPDKDGVVERDWEFPVHNKLLALQIPNTKKGYFVEVIRPDYAGIKGDMLSTYERLAKMELTKNGDKEALDKLNHWKYSLGYSYIHPCYVVDLDKPEDKQEIEIFPLSNGQFKTLQKSRFDVWEGEKRQAERDAKREADKQKLVGQEREQFIAERVNEVYCPMTNPSSSFPVVITREKTDRTTYDLKVDNYGEFLELDEKMAEKLFELPTIKEVYYQYSRYQFEATLVFLAQQDADYGISIMNHPEFIEVKDLIESQLKEGDNNGFKAKDEDGVEYTLTDLIGVVTSNAIMFDDLLNESDKVAEGINSGEFEAGGEEEGNLRGLIDAFIKQEGLPVVIQIGKTNDNLLDEIEAYYNNGGSTQPEKEVVPTQEEPATAAPAPQRRRRRTIQ